MQSAQVQLAHESAQFPHWQLAWLQVAQSQSAQVQLAQESVQLAHVQAAHSS